MTEQIETMRIARGKESGSYPAQFANKLLELAALDVAEVNNPSEATLALAEEALAQNQSRWSVDPDEWHVSYALALLIVANQELNVHQKLSTACGYLTIAEQIGLPWDRVGNTSGLSEFLDKCHSEAANARK